MRGQRGEPRRRFHRGYQVCQERRIALTVSETSSRADINEDDDSQSGSADTRGQSCRTAYTLVVETTTQLPAAILCVRRTSGETYARRFSRCEEDESALEDSTANLREVMGGMLGSLLHRCARGSQQKQR